MQNQMTAAYAPPVAQRTKMRVLFAFLFAFLLTMAATPFQTARASSEIGFDKTSTLVRGAMDFGALSACANKVYMPVRDGDDNLRITGMSLTNSGLANLPQAGNQHVGGIVNEIDIVGLNGCNYFVTAIRTQDNTLKLISWFSGSDGFERLGDSGNSNMAATELDVAGLGYPGHNPDPEAGMVIAAARSVSGPYALVSYGVVGGNFEQKDFELGESATEIAIVTLPPVDPTFVNGRAIVAYRNADGNLRLANYSVSNGGALTLQGSSGNQAGAMSQVALAAYDSNKVITAVKLMDGTLKLIPWRINDDGSISRLTGSDDPTFNDPTAGVVSEIDVVAYNASVPGMNHHVVTAVRTEGGDLRLIAWGINAGDIVRLGDSGNLAGAASQIRVAWSNNNQRIVTSMRDNDGNLRTIAWQVYTTAQALDTGTQLFMPAIVTK